MVKLFMASALLKVWVKPPIDALITARNEGGIFRDLFDLCARVDLKKLTGRTFESLIMSGALDKLRPHRAARYLRIEDAPEKL